MVAINLAVSSMRENVLKKIFVSWMLAVSRVVWENNYFQSLFVKFILISFINVYMHLCR